MHRDIPDHVKQCKACQQGKQQWNKCRQLPVKHAVISFYECLCVHVIGLYALKGTNNISYKVMCITSVDPATCMFEIEEIPTIISSNKKGVINKVFDKTSTQIGRLVYKA